MEEQQAKEEKTDQNGFLYGLDDKVPAGKSIVYGLQYLIFFIVASVIIPVIVGTALGLDQAEIARMLQRTFFFIGAISVLQGLFGHRMPIIDGPAGLWMGIILLLVNSSTAMGMDLSVLRTDLELGMICAGIMVCIIAASGLIIKILKIFTPIINGTFILLMVLQMSGTIMQGATGLSSGYATIQMRHVIVFIATVVIIILVNLKARGFIQSISMLVGVALGWVLAYILQIAQPITPSGQSFFAVPRPLVWGTPTVNVGVIVTCLIGQFVLFSNYAASVYGMSDVLHQPFEKREMKRGTFLFGVMAALSGIFCITGSLPLASTPSLIKITRVASRGPFLLGGIFAMVMGLITPICTFFSTIPAAVGYAALLVTFAMMIEQALRDYRKVQFTMREGMIVGVSLLVGIGIMFLDTSVFMNLPQMLQYIFSNGLIVGLIIAILMEHVFMRKKPAAKKTA